MGRSVLERMRQERDAWQRVAQSGRVSLDDLHLLGKEAARVTRAVRRELADLQAAVRGLGSDNPPSDEVLQAHHAAGGAWLLLHRRDHALSLSRYSVPFLRQLRETGTIARWVAVGPDGRVCHPLRRSATT